VNISISHQVILDQAAASIVYQVVDTKTDTVVTQFPDEACCAAALFAPSI